MTGWAISLDAERQALPALRYGQTPPWPSGWGLRIPLDTLQP